MMINKDVKVVVQGITGNQGRFHTNIMRRYGTQIVAGVSPGKSGENLDDVPVFDTVEEAVNDTNANASIIFVPAQYCKSSIFESIEMNLNPVVVITEGIPVHDTMDAVWYANLKKIRIIGPNTPVIIIPSQKIKIGIMPDHVFKPGNIGIVSRSGTLMYEIAANLSEKGLGQSVCIGKGGDPITGLSLTEILKFFEQDNDTKAVVMVGEIGGKEEEDASVLIKEMEKPVVAYIAGKNVPPGRRMGHAGAIIGGSSGGGTAENKIKVLSSVGVKIAASPKDVTDLLEEVI